MGNSSTETAAASDTVEAIDRCDVHGQPLVSIENDDADPECPDCYHGGGMILR